eukprot:CAMPEP_0113533268 /NCGR_PEP_ID=MMETSP0015_2-20120614/4507_1 /TAXON_ID=2838 /ORGANISM="Odontella" /LENGTH=370 /DNA_ID=CAMNT_0000432295 /DNA_START=215 /DNA_END=1327 /DNA_ORIENTATION=- /assembly_acc=CAM_ASM_000160
MPSLTPEHRAEETSVAAFHDGAISGALALVPSGACVYFAMRNPRFARSTNWQSRTALVIMPALFAFALTSESKLNHRMREMAEEAEHARATADWAERQRERKKRMAGPGASSSPTTAAAAFDDARAGGGVGELARTKTMSKEEVERQLTEMYRRSVEESGVRIVPGDSLGPHHRMSNFLMENPFKVLTGVGVPTVLYIFKGRNEKAHLQLQSKLMHTRIFGQFAVIGMLLSLMGFKSYMDSNGKYITEYEAQRKVDEMHEMKDRLKAQLERDRAKMEERDRVLRRAHGSDLKRLGHSGKKKDLSQYGVLEEDVAGEEETDDAVTKDEAEELVADAGDEKPTKSGRKKRMTTSDVTRAVENSIAPITSEET